MRPAGVRPRQSGRIKSVVLRRRAPPITEPTSYGEVAEWSNAADSKSVVRLRVPGVRIPPSPPSRSSTASCNILKVLCNPENTGIQADQIVQSTVVTSQCIRALTVVKIVVTNSRHQELPRSLPICCPPQPARTPRATEWRSVNFTMVTGLICGCIKTAESIGEYGTGRQVKKNRFRSGSIPK